MKGTFGGLLMRPAPPFSLADQTGTLHTLADYAGHWLVVYFYPKDDTPGCTKEACSFRDVYRELEAAGVSVVGISKDSVKSHAKFAEKYHLNFPLLADESADVIRAYGAWGSKKMMGREYDGIMRMTFLISPDGAIAKEYPKVTPEGHGEQILADVAALKGGGAAS
jgi:thioredoxin-dependent peroxiredoxin